MLPRIPGDPPKDLSKPLTQVRILIDDPVDGKRLDQALAQKLPWRSRTSIRRLIEQGRVHLEGRDASPSRKVLSGEIVVIDVPPRPETLPVEQLVSDLPILYEDRFMVAVDKPPGIAVHPAGRRLDGTLIHWLHKRYRRLDEPEHDVVPKLLHRIDVETSGVVAVGLDERFHARVARQFEDRDVTKTYLAVVHGHPDPPEGLVDLGIGPDKSSPVRLKLQARWDGSGQPALTRYRTLRGNARYSLVELQPQTGRTHQLRVHMAAIGCPLVGDKIYGGDEAIFLEKLQGELSVESRQRLVLERHALHSHRLRFRHPFLDRDLELVAGLPADMERLLE